MSVPAVADGTGWQSKRARRLEPAAWAYSSLVFLVAAVAAAVSVATAAMPSSSEWVEFALLAPLAALAPLLSVGIGRNHSFHTGAAFVVAGAIVLPAPLVVALAVVLHLPEWVKERYPWYMQGFNIANYTVSGLSAWAVANAVGGDGDLRTALGGVAAAAVFVLVNHGLLAGMLKLARGHSVRESGLFSSISFGTDLVLATLGVTVAAFVVSNPWLLPALLAPLLLAHRSLSVVALLRGSEERFRTMFESAATATLLIDRAGRVLTANYAAVELFKLDLAQLTGFDTNALIHPEEGPADDLRELLRGERERYRAERRLVDADGAVIFARLAVSLVRDADTHPQYAIAMIEDVTEQRELEERLRQAQKLEAIGRLAGGVAHDFNNMLTAIGGYNTFALERTEPGTPLHEELHEIRKATERATLLTRQLLAFSRKQILQPELLNLNAVILELESMLRPLIGEDVALTTQLDPALGPIEADPGQLQQVLMNLVVNARDAMPGGGTIAIETANAEVGDDNATIEAGRYVTLTVRDTGHGIDAATLEQIFEPFFTTKETGKGTGLGLATVYGIVKQSGGYVVVESEPDEGTAFTVFLRRDAEARLPRTEPTADSAVAQATAEPAAETVLLVEDEDVVRRLVRQVLENGGYRVLEAGDGEAALELARTAQVDLLLTDLVMPKIGGREVADGLRRTNPGLKVIYMSGYADGAILENGVLQPGTELLEKPFAFAALTEKVRSVLDG
ncbi:MAG TPA: ATP-binding protein [Gaiellaceae bacterium]|nr:ATP-binding protein [Gaiellaceae bacterium]